jgi:hypothetical protein
MTAAEGVARVATTFYAPGAAITNWISLYRYERGTWVPLPMPPHPVLQELVSEPNLFPTIRRNYGAADPLKVLRLDFAMERIRVDFTTRDTLRSINRATRHRTIDLDRSYVPLLQKYRNSDAPSVRFTAEWTVAQLTRQPNIPFWLDALAEQSGTPYQAMAHQIIAGYMGQRFKSEGMDVIGGERDELTTAAQNPDPIDPLLVPRNLPQLQNVDRVQRWDRFGVVAVRFGSGLLGQRGYSMLFERRGERWVFLCAIMSWIS